MAETPSAPMPSLAPGNARALERSLFGMATGPQKLVKLDLTRCSQISRERVQWLRMYVGDVVCENGKGGWAGVDRAV